MSPKRMGVVLFLISLLLPPSTRGEIPGSGEPSAGPAPEATTEGAEEAGDETTRASGTVQLPQPPPPNIPLPRVAPLAPVNAPESGSLPSSSSVPAIVDGLVAPATPESLL